MGKLLMTVDNGNGQIKGVTNVSHSKPVIYQAIAGLMNKANLSNLTNTLVARIDVKDDKIIAEKNLVLFEGDYYIVGSGAVGATINGSYNTAVDKTFDKTELVKILTCMHLLTLDMGMNVVIDALCVGLPPLEYTVQRAKFESFLAGEHSISFWDDDRFIKRTFIVKKVVVQQQSVGAAYSYALRNGDIVQPDFAKSQVLISDGGFRTWDLSLLDKMGFVKGHTVPLGMKEPFNDLIATLASDPNIHYNAKLVDIPSIAKNRVIEIPKPVDIGNHIDDIFYARAQEVINETRNFVGDLRKVRYIAHCGGGGQAFYKFMRRIAPEADHILIPDSELANAKGYLEFLLLLNKKGKHDE